MFWNESARDTVYRDLYEEGARILSGVIEEEREARLDARLLLEHVCGTNLQTLLLDAERIVPCEEVARYRELLVRRSKREPLAYIVGRSDFMGLTFAVDHRVLIPEQDTENLIEEIMKETCDGDRILDLCTGSGCILLSLLHYSNGSTGVGTDLSRDALDVAQKNAERLSLQDRCEWREGDLFEAVREGEKFDLIVSNPPYIRSAVIGGLAPEVQAHEPMMALDGGEDGLMFYKRIIPEACQYLVTGGMLYLEIGYDQAQEVTALMEEAGYYEVRTIRDYGGNDRIVCGIKSIHQK
ncbi:MAG: peptide chain release factor N(5)-glutamine methyltransferase [Lachnospiraceae bacterium]|nr:peptide chain release factor N(5)-glutamine methyltransferase [Lachnospiraceae bacterium]